MRERDDSKIKNEKEKRRDGRSKDLVRKYSQEGTGRYVTCRVM